MKGSGYRFFQVVQSDDWKKLVADEVIEDKYPDQNGYIPNQFNIAPADESLERASAGTKEAHDGSKNDGNDCGIETQSKGYKHSL